MDVAKLYARVEEALKKKNFDFAIELLKNQLLKFNPNDVKARQLLRGTVLKKHEVNGAPSKVQAFLKGLVPLIKMSIGKMGKKWDVVMDEAENYLQNDPRNVVVLYMLGEACLQAKYSEAAISVFENILAFNNNHINALKALGKIYFDRKATMDIQTQKEDARKTLEEAKKFYELAARLAPLDPIAPKMAKDIAAQITSLLYEDAKSSRDLIKDKDKAKELEKEKALRTDEDVREAIESAKKRLATDSQNKKELRRLADLYLRLTQYDDAMQTLEKVLQLDPTSFDLKCKIGECKIQKLEVKVQELQEKLKKSPQDTKLKQELQKAIQTKSDIEVQEYDLQAKAQPTNYEIRFKLGTALYQADRLDEAIVNLQQSMKDVKYSKKSYACMGQAFLKKKEFELAIEQFKSLLALLNSKDSDYRDALYSLGSAYEAGKKYPEAMESFMSIYKADIGYRDIQARVKKLREIMGIK